VSAPANLKPHHDIQGMTVNWVGGEPGLACCVCDNYQQAINTRAAPRFLLQPTVQSVCGHTGSQCCDEGDRGNWAGRWFHGTRVGTRVSLYPGINISNLYVYVLLWYWYVSHVKSCWNLVMYVQILASNFHSAYRNNSVNVSSLHSYQYISFVAFFTNISVWYGLLGDI